MGRTLKEIPRRWLPLLILAAALSPAAAADAQCVGDCDGDGQVTVNEIVLGVNIALGNQDVSACPAFADGGGQVTIAQLIQGVNNALNGCPPTPSPTPTEDAISTNTPTLQPTGTPPPPTPTALPPTATPTPTIVSPGILMGGKVVVIAGSIGALQPIVTTLVDLIVGEDGSPISFNAAQGGGAGVPGEDEQECELGGVVRRACEGGGDDPIIATLEADECVLPGREGGTIEVNGQVNITSTGEGAASCDPLHFTTAELEVDDLEIALFDFLGGEERIITADFSGPVEVEPDDELDCRLRRLSGVLFGDLESELPDLSGALVELDDTTVELRGFEYGAGCVPRAYTVQLDGPVIFTDLGELESFDVEAQQLVLNQDVSSAQILTRIGGGLDSECFGGRVDLQQLAMSIAIRTEELCPFAGELIALRGAVESTIQYTADGGVVIDSFEEFPFCLDPLLLGCVDD